jgi:hypothetical protein
MRNQYKEDSLGWEISFRNSSIKGSIPKDNSIRGSNPRWKDTFSIDDKGGEIYQMQDRNAWRERMEACRHGEKPQMEIPFAIDIKGGEIKTLMRSISMNVVMTKCCHQCQSGILSNSWLRLMESWYGLLVVIYLNHWRVIL